MFRVGIGHDTHRLAEGRPLVLGGVRVEYLVPIDQGPVISYPIGVVAASRQGGKARALLSWLRGEVATGIFTAAGFSVPAASTAL